MLASVFDIIVENVCFRISLCLISASPGVMVWDAIGYTPQSPLVHTYDTLNSGRYISAVFYPLFEPCETLRGT